jgi:acyl-CoA thioesterase-2
MTLSLRNSLALERLEVNLFRGTSPDAGVKRIFGGQVVAQALLAAYATVEERLCHSLHGYFIRPGDPAIPIIFEVDRSRDGASFTTRRVIAVQHGRQIFYMAASFVGPEPGYEHQFPMPDVPPPSEDMPELGAALKAPPGALPSHLQPIEMRVIDPPSGKVAGQKMEPRQRAWFRLRDAVPDEVRWHQVALAFASDIALLGTCMRPHGPRWDQVQTASLDHAVWFHRPSNLSEWHLFDMDSPSASGARGLNRGSIYRIDGTLVASCAQEGLIRPTAPL